MTPRMTAWQKLTVTLLILVELGFWAFIVLSVWRDQHEASVVRLVVLATIINAACFVVVIIGVAIAKAVRAVYRRFSDKRSAAPP